MEAVASGRGLSTMSHLDGRAAGEEERGGLVPEDVTASSAPLQTGPQACHSGLNGIQPLVACDSERGITDCS